MTTAHSSEDSPRSAPCPRFEGNPDQRCARCGEFKIMHWIDEKVQEAAVFEGLLKERRWPREVR